ncbi:MAG: phosphate ABC transporter substrate-binding/OmpA family protein [Pirellulales bacterium]
MAGQPKAPFFLVLGLVVIGLVGFAIYRSDLFAPEAGRPNGGAGGGPGAAGGGGAGEMERAVEQPGPAGVTTVSEYKFKPSERLPAIRGASQYQALEDNTVRFALNVWAGWGPIILANEGFKAGHVWKTPDGEEFKVELVLIDNPFLMQDAFASGNVHIGWGTLDMLPLFLERIVDAQGKPTDSRVMPRIYQQVDWSNGGDGIVVRESIRTIAHLRGKKIVLAQNSPSHYFLLNMLVASGVQPAEVEMVFTDDAFQAAAAFNQDRSLSGVVSWAPDIYNLEKVRGNELRVTTKEANKLIADVWFARADFAKDHPGILEGLVRGIFDAMVDLKDEAKKKRCAELMAEGYNIPATDTLAMFADAHNTNWAENYQFFMNQNNPANFERVWKQAYSLYRRVGSITHQPIPFDQVMDFSLIEKLGKEEKYQSQRNEYQIAFAPRPTELVVEADEILTNTVIIHFYPNSWELEKKITEEVGGKTVEKLYDPNVDFVLEEIAKLTGQFGGARVVISGHTDGSMKGQAPPELVKELSHNRANAVKEALVQQYQLDPNQLNVRGAGWDEPADSTDPDNHFKNRRVEIKIVTAERE